MGTHFAECNIAVHKLVDPHLDPHSSPPNSKLKPGYDSKLPHAFPGDEKKCDVKDVKGDSVMFVNMPAECIKDFKAWNVPANTQGFPGILRQGKYVQDVKKHGHVIHKKDADVDNMLVYTAPPEDNAAAQKADQQAVEDKLGVSVSESQDDEKTNEKNDKAAKDKAKKDKEDADKAAAAAAAAAKKEKPKKAKTWKRSPNSRARRAPVVGDSMVAALEGRYVHPTEED